MNMMEALEPICNTNETLQRFCGNEKLMEKFVKKFAGDPTFEQLCTDMKEKDYAAAEQAAHTLKGICGNLGFTELFELASQVVASLRVKDETAAIEAFEKMQGAYQIVLERVRQID